MKLFHTLIILITWQNSSLQAGRDNATPLDQATVLLQEAVTTQNEISDNAADIALKEENLVQWQQTIERWEASLIRFDNSVKAFGETFKGLKWINYLLLPSAIFLTTFLMTMVTYDLFCPAEEPNSVAHENETKGHCDYTKHHLP